MKWYEKTITENKAKIVSLGIFAIISSLVILLWRFGVGKTFQWETISPISQPEIFNRLFYSALVFITIGAFLYWLRFYQLLYRLIVKALGDWQLYNSIKKILWGSLMLLMYFWIVPKVVDLLNSIISFLYNILNLILYLFPPMGASLIIFSVGYYVIVKSKYAVRKSN